MLSCTTWNGGIDTSSQLCVIMSILNRSYRIGLVTESLPMEEEVAGLCV